MTKQEANLLQRESFLLQELQRMSALHPREDVRKASRLITGEPFYSDRELRERKQQLHHELNEVRAEREQQLQHKLNELRVQYEYHLQEPQYQSNSSALETAVKVGTSGLIGYALGKAIASVK